MTRTSMNRLWGIPLLGILVRAILAIPLYVVLAVVSFVVSLVALVSWIPVLFTARQAGWIYGINGFYVDWSTRLGAYLLLMVGGYPLSDDFGARVLIDQSQQFNRLWGIPLLGVFVRWIVLIPHYIVLGFLGIAVWLITWVSWIPVLLLGHQAEFVVHRTVVRWSPSVTSTLHNSGSKTPSP